MRTLNQVIILISALLFPLSGFAQNKSITGKVTDESGEAIIGANVKLVGNGSVGTITNMEGYFSLSVPNEGILEITYIGYVAKRVSIGKSTIFNVVLNEDSKSLDEVVVVGYGAQKKVNLTGAVSAIKSEEMVATKSQNVQNMLTGKVPGVRVIQKTSEPGELTNQFDIRGFGAPLIVVDGVPRSNFERMDPNEIESVSVLKDASAAIYGVRAANGVVLITTKRGDKNRSRIEYNMYYGIQTPAEVLQPVGAAERMVLFNEKSMRNTTNPQLKFTQDEINAYLNGDKRSTNWYNAVMNGTAPQQQHNVSISGGGDKMDYFINLGYTDQEGFFKKGAMDYDRYNLRSNVTAQITKHLKASVRINGILDKKQRQQIATFEIYKALWRSIPDEPIYANDNPEYYWKPGADIVNVLAAVDSEQSGYNIASNRIFQSSVDMEYTVPFVKGLKVKGMFSYDNSTSDNTDYRKEYNEYKYNATNGTYQAYPRQSPTYLNRYYGNSYNMLWQASVSYDNTFAKVHHVSGLLLFEEMYGERDNINASREFSIAYPYLFAGNSENQTGTSNANGIGESASRALVGRFNYDLKSRYLAEFSFRYDGSSKFPSNSRWGFFPSVSLGWRVAEEAFIKNNLTFVDNLKLRASWGRMGDDSVADYQFVTGYNYPNTSGDKLNTYPKGYIFNGNFINAVGFRALANPNITWFTVDTWNIGVDVDMWGGLLGASLDAFMRNRDGLMADRLSTIPGTFGATMPKENLESDRSKGVEVELRHRNRIGNFTYSVTGNASVTRTMWRYKERNPSGNSYENWKNNITNRYNDIWFGWGSGGRYQSYNHVAYSPVYTGNATLPGDYIYEDWNNDGIIDDMDRYPIATTVSKEGTDANKFENKRNYPLMNFGITLTGAWKGVDMNMTFQGAGMSYVAFGEQLSSPLAWEGNALDLFMDRWRPADSTQDPYDPRVQWIPGYYAYGGIAPDNNSGFAIQKGTYLRLKSMEVGYALPKQWLSSVGVKNLRVFVNAYNLFTLTGVKGVDPEKPAELNGYMYPLNRTYNFGASVTF